MGAGGAILPPQGYFEKVQEVLRKYDILFVADEVICGFARTSEMWGCQTYGIRPDMMTSAKALSAAMQPISAVLVNDLAARGSLRRSNLANPRRMSHRLEHSTSTRLSGTQSVPWSTASPSPWRPLRLKRYSWKRAMRSRGRENRGA